MDICFDSSSYDISAFQAGGGSAIHLPPNIVFQYDTFQCDTFQWVSNPSLSTVFSVVLYETRLFTYMVLAKTDAQALILANNIKPTAHGLPDSIVLKIGPQQKNVGVESITDQYGGRYFTCLTVIPLSTPSVAYVQPTIIDKIYSVSIQENRHTNYSFVGTPENLQNVLTPLNPSLNVDPVGGRRTSPPTPDEVDVLSVVEVTGGSYRNVFNIKP